MARDYAEINGTGCRYEVSGDGPRTLVLVHELGGSLESWDDLAALFPRDLRIVRHDLRGAGMSEKLRGRHDLDTLADDIAALLDHLGVDGPVDLMGAAAGASVCVRFANRHASRCGSLVLVAPALGVPLERNEQVLATADLVEREGLRAVATAVLPSAFPEEKWANPAAKARTVARWLGADPEGYAAMYRAIAHPGVLGELDRLTQRVLMLVGSDDPFSTPDRLRQLAAAIDDCRLEVIDAGHFAALQSPETVLQPALTFLRDTGARE